MTRIEVTRADIESGCEKNGMWCPIALAVWRQTGEHLSVSPTALRRDGHRVAALPMLARAWMTSYDNGQHVGPFAFEVDL
jgi:hypothetical protein